MLVFRKKANQLLDEIKQEVRNRGPEICMDVLGIGEKELDDLISSEAEDHTYSELIVIQDMLSINKQPEVFYG